MLQHLRNDAIVTIQADRDIRQNAITLQMVMVGSTGHAMRALPIAFADLGEGDVCPPFMEIRKRDAQALMDELWRCGIRPSNEIGSTGQLDALQKHLEDMRQMTFNHLGIPKP